MSSRPSMTVDVARVDVARVDDRYALVRVTGEIDIATTAELNDALEHAQTLAPATVVDLSTVWFCAAAGVHCLDHAIDTGQVRLVYPTLGPVAMILGILELDQRWPVHHELTEAIAGLVSS